MENRDSSWVSFVTGPDIYAKVVNDNVPASCIDFSYDMFGQKLNHDGTGGKTTSWYGISNSSSILSVSQPMSAITLPTFPLCVRIRRAVYNMIV